MSEKMLPCCSRKALNVTMAETDLRKVARRASAAPHRGGHFAPLIAKAKADLANAKQYQIDHEADHAGEVTAA